MNKAVETSDISQLKLLLMDPSLNLGVVDDDTAGIYMMALQSLRMQDPYSLLCVSPQHGSAELRNEINKAVETYDISQLKLLLQDPSLNLGLDNDTINECMATLETWSLQKPETNLSFTEIKTGLSGDFFFFSMLYCYTYFSMIF